MVGGQESNLTEIVGELTLENRKLKEDAEARLQFSSVVAKAANSTYSIDEFFQGIFPYILNIMNSSRGSIVLRSQNPLEHEDQLYITIHDGIPDADIENRLINFEDGNYIQRALETGHEIIINETGHSYHNSSIVMPFGWDRKLQGAVCVSSKDKGYTEQDSLMLRICMNDIQNQIQHVVERRRSKQIYINCVEARDPYTAVHNVVVGLLASLIAAECEMSVAEQHVIGVYAGLHDIGKIAIPDTILIKEGRLDEDEFEIMKQHPAMGRKMLTSTDFSSSYGDSILLHHHEWFDGSGYPDNLSGEDISIVAKIVAVADAFHAMNSSRCYRQKLDAKEIIKKLAEGEHNQFDPHIVPTFIDMLESIVYTQKRRKEIGLSFHTPFCEYAQHIPGNEFIVAKKEQIEQIEGYFPCPECYPR